MEDFYTDNEGNKRDKKSGQVLGTNQTTTYEPKKPEKDKKNAAKQIMKDILTATKNNNFGMGGAEMSGALPTEQQMQNDTKVVNEIAEKTGMDITSPYAIRNTPVHPGDEVDEYLKDPANYDPSKEGQRENEVEKPEVIEMPQKETTPLGSAVEPNNGEVKEEEVTPEESKEEIGKAPSSANVDFSDYLKNYYGPKNGADYLKALWSNGAGGKAAAIGNVLGNLLGATGKGLAGQDYKTDWQTYKDNYIKEMADRNQKAFDQNMDISRQLRTNDVARGEMLKALDQYAKIGKGMTPEKFENIRKALTATGNSSQMEYYLSSVLGDLTSDPDFMKAVKDAGSNASELLGNLTKFGANTLKPLNYVFGGLK